MKDYFEAEMRHLLDSAQDFAEAYPEQASMLNLTSVKDRDPYVERLLEGMAYLTAQVRQRIDDSVPELSESLLNQLNPALCRDYPAHCIVEVQHQAQSKECNNLARGARISSAKVGPEQTECTFSTTRDTVARPLTLHQVRSEKRLSGGVNLRFTLRKPNGVAWQDLNTNTVPIYIYADWPLAYGLFELLTHPDSHAQAFQGSRQWPVMLSSGNLSEQPGMLPETGREHSAYSLLHDYFCARERFLFVALEGMEQIDLTDDADEVDIVIESPVPLPQGHNVSDRTLRLNCVPTINLFPAQAEPVSYTHKRAEYALRVDHTYHGVAHVYAVKELSGRDPRSGQVRAYQPLHAMRYRTPDACTYREQSRLDSIGQRQTFLTLHQGANAREEVLSIDVLANNAQLPRRHIELAEIMSQSPEVPKDLTLCNITRPSRMLSPPPLQDFQWQLVSLLSSSLSALDTADKLRHMLSLFDWTEQVENRNRIQAIDSLNSALRHQINQGALCQVVQLTLEINESGFSSRSDMYLFGTVLHHFFTAFANVTEFVETRIVALPSYKEWSWKPSIGKKAVL